MMNLFSKLHVFLRFYYGFPLEINDRVGAQSGLGPGPGWGTYGPMWALMGPYGPLWVLLDRSWKIT